MEYVKSDTCMSLSIANEHGWAATWRRVQTESQLHSNAPHCSSSWVRVPSNFDLVWYVNAIHELFSCNQVKDLHAHTNITSRQKNSSQNLAQRCARARVGTRSGIQMMCTAKLFDDARYWKFAAFHCMFDHFSGFAKLFQSFQFYGLARNWCLHTFKVTIYRLHLQ